MKQICFLLLFTLSIQAQFQVNGIVKESTNHLLLPPSLLLMVHYDHSDVDGNLVFPQNIPP
jgi:hypothetical protein